MKKGHVEVFEIWALCGEGTTGHAIRVEDGRDMRTVARIVGSKIVYLEHGFAIQKRLLSKEKVENIYSKKYYESK